MLATENMPSTYYAAEVGNHGRCNTVVLFHILVIRTACSLLTIQITNLLSSGKGHIVSLADIVYSRSQHNLTAQPTTITAKSARAAPIVGATAACETEDAQRVRKDSHFWSYTAVKLRQAVCRKLTCKIYVTSASW